MTDQSNDILGAATTAAPAAAETVTQEPVAQPASTANPYLEKLAAIKNEEGLQKYASVDDALASVSHKEEFIRTLKEEKQLMEQELNTARQELERRMSVEDAMSQIASTPAADQTGEHKGLSREEVVSMVREANQLERMQELSESNRKSVNDALVKTYGDVDKAVEMMDTKLKELGMSRQELAAIAERSPKAALRMMGVDAKAPAAVNKSVAGSINPDAMESSFNKEVPKSKGIMLGASTKDLVNEWRLSGLETQR